MNCPTCSTPLPLAVPGRSVVTCPGCGAVVEMPAHVEEEPDAGASAFKLAGVALKHLLVALEEAEEQRARHPSNGADLIVARILSAMKVLREDRPTPAEDNDSWIVIDPNHSRPYLGNGFGWMLTIDEALPLSKALAEALAQRIGGDAHAVRLSSARSASDSLPETIEARVRHYLSDGGESTAWYIAEKLAAPTEEIEIALRGMEANGEVECVSAARRWRAREEER